MLLYYHNVVVSTKIKLNICMIYFADTDSAQWHLRQIGLDSVPNTLHIEEFEGPKRAVFHVPFPWEHGLGDAFSRRFANALIHCDRIAVLVSELHQHCADFIKNNQHPKVQYFLCGHVRHCKSTPWMDWFITSTQFYKINPILEQLLPYQVKPKTFDILLGLPKAHRTFVYDYINKHKLNDQVIMTYMNPLLPIQQHSQEQWLWEPGVEVPPYEFNWTVTQVKYHGYNMSLSQVVPISIYNQTAYSVVCETNFHNSYSFNTEKIVKPILGERLFVMFSSQHYLKNLRSLGFKTFDGIINETYDTVADTQQRWIMACEQMTYLFNSPQEEILAKVKPITEHNRRVMLETDWNGNYFREFEGFLRDYTNQN